MNSNRPRNCFLRGTLPMWPTSGGDEPEGAWKVKSGSFAALGSGKLNIVTMTKKKIL